MSTSFLARLTGWQITAMVCTALLVPSSLFAAVAFSNVAVVNPTAGYVAVVDSAGNFHTTDAYGVYQSNPANKVTIAMPELTGDGCQSHSYTIPAGKALIITAMTGNYFNDDGIKYAGIAIYGSANCSGNAYSKHFVPMQPTIGDIVDINYDFGTGIAIPAGSLSVYTYSDSGWLFIHGYLVPSSLVGASALQSPTGPTAPKPGPSAK